MKVQVTAKTGIRYGGERPQGEVLEIPEGAYLAAALGQGRVRPTATPIGKPPAPERPEPGKPKASITNVTAELKKPKEKK